MVNVGFSLEQIDIVLNALDTKAMSIMELKNRIYNDVKMQVDSLNQPEEKGEKNKDGKHKNNL